MRVAFHQTKDIEIELARSGLIHTQCDELIPRVPCKKGALTIERAMYFFSTFSEGSFIENEFSGERVPRFYYYQINPKGVYSFVFPTGSILVSPSGEIKTFLS